MAISGDYSQPVSVNGYQCWNCTDVANARKNIDPAHPKSGPYGIDSKQDPTAKQSEAVTFGGSLSSTNIASPAGSDDPDADDAAPGTRLDISA
jgi:hypothetical protein